MLHFRVISLRFKPAVKFA